MLTYWKDSLFFVTRSFFSIIALAWRYVRRVFFMSAAIFAIGLFIDQALYNIFSAPRYLDGNPVSLMGIYSLAALFLSVPFIFQNYEKKPKDLAHYFRFWVVIYVGLFLFSLIGNILLMSGTNLLSDEMFGTFASLFFYMTRLLFWLAPGVYAFYLFREKKVEKWLSAISKSIWFYLYELPALLIIGFCLSPLYSLYHMSLQGELMQGDLYHSFLLAKFLTPLVAQIGYALILSLYYHREAVYRKVIK